MKILDKFEDFIRTELEVDYVMKAFLLIISICIVNAVTFCNSTIGHWIAVVSIGLYGLYVGLCVIVILCLNYKKNR